MAGDNEWFYPTPGAVLGGKYELEAELGRGGMGVVFRAMHRGLGERVAVKVQLPASNAIRSTARFKREIKAAMRLRGEHCVRLLDVGQQGETFYFVMELLEGCDLKHLLETRGRLSLEESVGLTLQACEALAEAHSLGIIHRDIKPANLFLSRRFDGQPLLKVLDFGVAKAIDEEAPSRDSLTSSSASIGTPMYMAPEQIRDAKRVGAEADLWALGVVLFELWTGKTPFHAETAQGLLATILADEPADIASLRPDTPPVLASSVLRCLKKNPEERLRSAYDLAASLAPLAPPWARVPRPPGEPVLAAEPRSPPAPSSTGLSQTEEESISLVASRPGIPDARSLPSPPLTTAREAPSPSLRRRHAAALAGVVALGGVVSLGRREEPVERPSPAASSLPASSAWVNPSARAPAESESAPAAAPSSPQPAASASAPGAPGERARPARTAAPQGKAKPPVAAKTSGDAVMERAIENRD